MRKVRQKWGFVNISPAKSVSSGNGERGCDLDLKRSTAEPHTNHFRSGNALLAFGFIHRTL